MDRCPICDVAVRPENLLHHLNDIHPRHPDTPKLVERLKAEPGRIAARTPSRPLHISRLHVVIVVVVILLGIVTYYLVVSGSSPPPLPCVSGNGLAYHWHAQLTITAGGYGVMVPGGIGFRLMAIEVFDTDKSGVGIHILPGTVARRRRN